MIKMFIMPVLAKVVLFKIFQSISFPLILSGSFVIQKQVVNNIYHHLIKIFLPPFSLAKKPQRDLQITTYYICSLLVG